MNVSFVYIYLYEYMSLRKYVRPVICHLVLYFLVLEKGLSEKVQMPSNKLHCSCLYGILNMFLDNEPKGLLLTMQDH